MAVSPRAATMMRRANKRMASFAARVPPWAVVQHVGRRSGTRYRTPVMAFRARGDVPLVVTPMPWGSDVDWCRNIRAAGSFTLTRGRRDYTVDDLRVVDPDEAATLVGTPARVSSRLFGVREWLVGRPRPVSS